MSNSLSTDTSMFGRLRRNEVGAWDGFVARYAPRIYGWAKCRSLADADCEDVTQEVLLKLFKGIQRFEYDPERRFRSYLRTLTENAVNDCVKERMRHGQGRGQDAVVGLLESEAARGELCQQIEEEYDLELVQIACRHVQLHVSRQAWERCRPTLPGWLDGEGRTIAEAAAKLGVSPALIYQARWQVLNALRKEVERLGGPNRLDQAASPEGSLHARAGQSEEVP
jgi:RNA polymerase sigma-70 factor (ECF subfamily)